MLSLLEFEIVAGVALLTLIAAILWSAPVFQGSKTSDKAEPTPLAMLFEDGVLHHATDSAKDQLGLEPGAYFWGDLREKLLARFPDFPDSPVAGKQGQKTCRALDDFGPEQASIRWRGSYCWVSLLHSDDATNNPVKPELEEEVLDLRRMRDCTPDPVWQVDQSGNVRWFNKAYETLYHQVHGGDVDTRRSLFSDCNTNPSNRVTLSTDAGEPPDIYQLVAMPSDEVTVFHATRINAVVEAENAQRNFMQTLAKTFAHLSIGLAIFDRDGQLTIFNPALVDLTGLPAHFLSARPTMLSFFDQLRENRGMPEPKNYHSWREEIAGVIAEATDGRYQETWTLESGQTYSVKGRPHPDGATAFLIEDISAEMTLTRNFRAELEQGQMLMDTVDEAMAVFSPTGVLTFTNAAYRNMWQVDPDASFADILIRDSVVVWRQKLGTSRVWRSIEEFVTEFGDRQAWNIDVGKMDNEQICCHLLPLPSGSTLVQFRKQAVVPPLPKAKELQLRTG